MILSTFNFFHSYLFFYLCRLLLHKSYSTNFVILFTIFYIFYILQETRRRDRTTKCLCILIVIFLILLFINFLVIPNMIFGFFEHFLGWV